MGTNAWRGLMLMVALAAGSGCGAAPPTDEVTIGTGASRESDPSSSAITLTQRREGVTYLTKLAREGAVTTELADDSSGAPVHRAIVRYQTADFLALDFATKTALTSTLSAAATNHSAQLKARKDVLDSLGSTDTPSAPIRCSRLHQRIHGLEARAYSTTRNGAPARVWYTDDLPKPPRALRTLLGELAATEPTQPSPPHRDDHEVCDDDDDDGGGTVTSSDLAGSVLLRSESYEAGVWKITLDTTAVSRSTLTAAELEVPADWSVVSETTARGAKRAASTSASPSAASSSSPTAIVVSSGGPQITEIEAHVFYWGKTFADPAHVDAVHELDNAISTIVGPDGFAQMGQYAVKPGHLKASHIVDARPPSAVLQDFVSIFATEGFVSSVMGNEAPLFWWKWGPDPLIVVVVNADEVGSSASFSGYHLDYISPGFLLPFPLDLMTNPFMPFALVTVNDDALKVPAGAMAARDDCPGGASCGLVSSFDTATENLSHEIFEAVTDPYPFSGYFDPTKFPWWNLAEVGDICEAFPYRSRVGDYVLATYWSNVASDCVGDYRSTVHLDAPVGILASGASIQGSATATAAIDRGHRLNEDVTWTLDGIPRGTGLSVNLGTPPAGSHHVIVTVRDANGYIATDEGDFTVADCVSNYGGSCGSCGGTVRCDGSCTVDTPGNLGQACGSCGGSFQCDGSCSVATPGDLGQPCGCGGTVQCNGACSSSCSLEVDFSNIDDDAYIWLNVPGFDSDPAKAFCQINQGSVPRTGSCDVGAFMRAQSMSSATFIVKIGNGGCFNSHGDISFVMNGAEAWHGHKADTGTFTHCGWTYRAAVSVDVSAGSVSLVDENFCFNVTDCPF